MAKRQYIVNAEYTIHQVFAAIRNKQIKLHKANLSGLRMQNFFLHGVVCVTCGRAGTVFRVERTKGGFVHKYCRWHLNLYTADNVLMTADHIVPKSRGGKTELDNLQPMCSYCNAKKGNSMPGDPVKPPKAKKRAKKKTRKKLKADVKNLDFKRLLSPFWLYRAIRFGIKHRMMPGLPHKRTQDGKENQRTKDDNGSGIV